MRVQRRTSLAAVAAVGLVSSLIAAAGPASAGNPNNSKKFTEAVTVEGIMNHLEALQAIAEANGGNREAGTSGYDASGSYVESVLQGAGYDTRRQYFDFEYQAQGALQQISPTATTYVTDSFTGSGAGDVTATVTAVDISLAPPRASTSGCEAADFAGFPAGNIALIQRGTCDFGLKADNAEAAGAVGRHHLQPGQHPGPRAPDRRHARDLRREHSRRRCLVRHRGRPG